MFIEPTFSNNLFRNPKDLWKKMALRITKKIPFEDAISFFDQLTNCPDLALDYPFGGCFARTHLICEAAAAIGFYPKKAWAFQDHSLLLYPDLPGWTEEAWAYHVAPVLAVKIPNGEARDMVFDPILFDGPVSLKNWGLAIRANPNKLQIQPFGYPPKGHRGDYMPGLSTEEALLDPSHKYHPLKEIARCASLQNSGRARTVFPSPERQEGLAFLQNRRGRRSSVSIHFFTSPAVSAGATP